MLVLSDNINIAMDGLFCNYKTDFTEYLCSYYIVELVEDDRLTTIS